MIINNKRIDLSYMFYNCKSLKKFYRISKEENNFNSENEIKKEKKDGQIENKYDSSETNNKLSYKFYHFNKSKKEFNETFINKNKDKSFKYRNKLNLIYIYSNNKNILSDENKKKMNEIIIKSNNFLSPSYSFYLFKLQTNNNMNENISIKDYEIPSSLSEITQRKKVTNKNTNFSQVFDPLILSLDYSLKKIILFQQI